MWNFSFGHRYYLHQIESHSLVRSDSLRPTTKQDLFLVLMSSVLYADWISSLRVLKLSGYWLSNGRSRTATKYSFCTWSSSSIYYSRYWIYTSPWAEKTVEVGHTRIKLQDSIIRCSSNRKTNDQSVKIDQSSSFFFHSISIEFYSFTTQNLEN